MRVITRDMRRKCDAPRCERQATTKVNLAGIADYMAKAVCEQHVDWAAAAIEKHVPTDR